MGEVWVREFNGGLDTRRLFEASSANILVKAENCHVTRGGELSKRFTFAEEYSLPAGTVGMARDSGGLVVFGHTTEPAGVPTGVTYQKLTDPADSGNALVRVLSFSLFQDKVYAVGEFADGSVLHFYDGTVVADWYDGRASASFNVTGGENTAAAAASGSFEVISGSNGLAEGSFEITGGTNDPGVNDITDVTIDGGSIITSAVSHTGDNETTADAVAAEINSTTSSPNFNATAEGAVVVIVAATDDSSINGAVVAATTIGDVTVGNETNMSGGATAGEVTEVRVGGVNLLSSSVAHTSNDETTADAIATEINANTTSPDYSASATGSVVTITAAATGTAANGRQISTATVGDISLGNEVDFSGGVAANVSTLNDLKIDGVSLISAAVSWTTSNTDTAAAIAAAVNANTSSPNYTATSTGVRVNIIAASQGADPNGKTVDFSLMDGLAVSPENGLEMSGGSDAVTTYQPGSFVKTISSKMHAVSGPNMHFSGIQQPTRWKTDAVGAGFIDLSSESEGFEVLTSLARYQDYVAAFSDEGIQLWFVDPDPENYRIVQTLNNTGTDCRNSVTQFGDEDVFYLDESGLRSLRSRATINVASTTDIGVPVDDLITEKLRGLTDTEKGQVYGLIEPSAGSFWLVMKDTIYVFTFYRSAQISAWTTYKTTDGDGVAFDAEAALVHQRRVYIRSGDTIYCYGGKSTGRAYDENTKATIWLPYLDAERPTADKSWDGIDVACLGEWDVYAATQPQTEKLNVQEYVGKVWRTTFNEDRVPYEHSSTHLSLRFESVGGGEHRLGSVVINYGETGDAG